MTGALWGKSTLEKMRLRRLSVENHLEPAVKRNVDFNLLQWKGIERVLGIEVTSFGILKLTKNKQKPLNIHSGGLIKGNKRASKRKN